MSIQQCRDAEETAGEEGENSDAFRKLPGEEKDFILEKIIPRITVK